MKLTTLESQKSMSYFYICNEIGKKNPREILSRQNREIKYPKIKHE